MTRQPILAFGLVALALALAPGQGLSPRASAADGPHAPAAKAESNPAAMTPGEAEHLEEAHAEEVKPDILKPEPSLAIWTVVVFLGLLFVLGRFAWKPLLAALHQREEHLEHCLLETERVRNESEQLLAAHRRQLEQAADQVRALIEQSRRDASASAEEITTKARAEAEAERHRARADIENARDQALVEIWSKAADLAVSVAGRVLTKQIDESEHRRLVESAIGELPTQPTSSNGHGQGGRIA